MTTKRTWAIRAAALCLSATAVVGVSAVPASAAGSTCTPPGSRPTGPVTDLLWPLIGDAGYNNGVLPLGNLAFGFTGLLDMVVCPLLP